jgi:hypothetical protein
MMYKNMKNNIYRTVILSVLCGCETWSLTLREEHSLMVLENRALEKIFVSNAGKITGDGKRLHIEEPFGLYSPKIMRVINENEMGVARLGDRSGACSDWWGDLRKSVH